MKPILSMKFGAGLLRAAVAVSCFAALVGLATACFAEDSGRTDFIDNCAGCHGVDGKGRGASLYVIPGITPRDLTQLSKQNGGVFPFKAAEDSIDGRRQIPSHKRFDMPFWGVKFQEPGKEFSAESEAKTKARIDAIVRYIETLQQP